MVYYYDAPFKMARWLRGFFGLETEKVQPFSGIIYKYCIRLNFYFKSYIIENVRVNCATITHSAVDIHKFQNSLLYRKHFIVLTWN